MTKTTPKSEPNTNFNTDVVQSRSTQKARRRVLLSRIKRKILHHVWILRGLILTFILILICGVFLLVSILVRRSGLDFYINLTKDFIFTPSEKIKLQDTRTNILILGKGGAGHDAPDLTDTIIFTSVNHKDQSVTLISLPRDIWIPQLRAKLNSIYYWGNKKQDKGGVVLAKATVEEIVGQSIHYAVVVDFSGFKKIIDILGRIEVDVENAFTDERYPIPGREDDECDGEEGSSASRKEFKCRYETIHFEKGIQYMDGETALKFVRSRYAQGDEGTDLARAKRQQRVILALKDKVLSRDIIFSPSKLLELKKAVEESVETDIDPSAGVVLARRILSARDSVSSRVVPEDLLENPPKSPRYDNLYVFIAKNADWSEVHKWVDCVLGKVICN